MTSRNLQLSEFAAAATGCPDAGGYIEFAQIAGYPHIIEIDICSSAGDWWFLVSKNRKDWHHMTQENAWPKPGFVRRIEPRPSLVSTHKMTDEQVQTQVQEIYG